MEELPEALESTCGKVKSKASWFYRAKALMVEGVTTQPVHELCRANSAVWDLLPRRQELQAREYHLCDLSCRITSSSLRFEDANDLMTLRDLVVIRQWVVYRVVTGDEMVTTWLEPCGNRDVIPWFTKRWR